MADAVARDERPQVRELDPLGLLARDVVAREDLSLERAQERADRLLGGIHLQRLAPVEGRLVTEEAEPVVGTKVDPADAKRTPALAAQTNDELAPAVVCEAQEQRIVAFHDGEVARLLEQHLDSLSAHICGEGDTYLDLLALQCAFALDLHRGVDTGRADEHQPDGAESANGAATATSSGRRVARAASKPSEARPA